VALLVGQYRVELEPGLVLTRTLPSIVEDDWWVTWVATGPVLRRLALADHTDESFFEFLRRLQHAVHLYQDDGEPLPYLLSGGGSESAHELRLRFPVGITESLDIRYVWEDEVGREAVRLPAP
jgi:hypothetical protein